MNNTLIRYSLIVLLSGFMLLMFCCKGGDMHCEGLDIAERIMEEKPDSAFKVLETISKDSLSGEEEKARYALLMSMALEKNYIDTTNFDVLQPAIDYYLTKNKGNADDKLKTLYYKGCIYFNANNYEDAMVTFFTGKDVKGITDSLTYARLLVIQGTLNAYQYKQDKCIENNLIAAKIYKKYNNIESEINSYTRALGAAIFIDNKVKSDSLYTICCKFKTEYPEYKTSINYATLSYRVENGSEREIRECLSEFPGFDYTNGLKLDIARGYLRINEPVRALDYLDSIEMPLDERTYIRYYLLRSEAEEQTGNYKAALKSYQEFTNSLESFHDYLFNQDLLFSEKKHELEMSNLKEVEQRNRIILLGIAVILLLLMLGGLLYYRYRLVYTRRELSEEENRRLLLEKERQEQEVMNLQLDRVRLEELLEEQKALEQPLRDLIKERLKLLDNVLAKEISSDDTHYSKAYRKWIDSIHNNRDEFIKSTRQTLNVLYPGFMNYMASAGLNDQEMKYICLYAIGLRGKDVGDYLGSKSQYNVTLEIRKKLNMDKRETNLRVYVRRLMDKLG